MHAKEAAALSRDIIGEVFFAAVETFGLRAGGRLLLVAIGKATALVAAFRLLGLDFVIVLPFAFDGDLAGEGNFFPPRLGDERNFAAVDCAVVIVAPNPAFAAAVPTTGFVIVLGNAFVGRTLLLAMVALAR